MIQPWRRVRWSPYLAGTLIGALSCFVFLTADHPLGASTAIARTAGMLEHSLFPAHVDANSYFRKFPPVVDWEWTLVLGMALGAFLSSCLSHESKPEKVPSLWRKRFGPSIKFRYVGAFTGGAIMMFGARIAGGCTSGHGISGSLQLALSGWTFFLCLFASGTLTAFALYRKVGE
jgi:uncharacterized membrane protein YedE/YeeE